MRQDGAAAVVGSRRPDQDPFARGRDGRAVVGVGLGSRVEGADLLPTPFPKAVMIHAARGFEALKVARGGVPPRCADQRSAGGEDDRRTESVARHAVGGLEGCALHPLAGRVALVRVDGARNVRLLRFVGLALGRRGGGGSDEQPVVRGGERQAEVGAAVAVLAASGIDAPDAVALDRARGAPGAVGGALEDVQGAALLPDEERVAGSGEHGAEPVGALGVGRADDGGLAPAPVRPVVHVDRTGAEVGVGLGDVEFVAVDHDRVAERAGLGREGGRDEGGKRQESGSCGEFGGRLVHHGAIPVGACVSGRGFRRRAAP